MNIIIFYKNFNAEGELRIDVVPKLQERNAGREHVLSVLWSKTASNEAVCTLWTAASLKQYILQSLWMEANDRKSMYVLWEKDFAQCPILPILWKKAGPGLLLCV